MRKKLENLLLILIFISGLITFTLLRYNGHYQRNVIYVTGGLYFLWSLYHHYHRGDLHLSIIIEYLVFITFGLIILSSTFLF